MSMVVKNNMSAIHTLNTLNQNSSSLHKSLAKVSSGMKITSAQDDASAYAISERMRVQIRSLDQANQNTQTDLALLKTAEGAVSSTLELVKTMKEKAIDAANDSNTDEDRKIIQKEIEQYIDQVDDNALITFNNKHLLLGESSSLYNHDIGDHEAVIRGLSSAWIGDALSLIEETYGMSFEQQGNHYHEMEVHFAGTNEKYSASGHEGYTAWIGPESDNKLHLYINMDVVKNMDPTDENGLHYVGSGDSEDSESESTSGGTAYLDRVISHEMTHGIMQSMLAPGVMASLPSWIKEGGTAEMTHGADERDLLSVVSDPFNSDAYAGGFVAMRFLTHQIGSSPQETMKQMMRGLMSLKSTSGGSGGDGDEEGGDSSIVNGALSYATGGAYKSVSAFQSAYNAALSRYGEDTTAFLKEECGIILGDVDTGAVSGQNASGRNPVKSNHSVVPQASRPVNWSLPSSQQTVIKGLLITWPAGYNAGPTGGSMVFHTGAGANQAMHVGLYDMRARSIGLIDQEGQKLDVTTIGKANAAIGLLDKIVNVVLDEATNIGSMESRLEYTSSNLTVSTENVQGAESTIRDADMAKEMTNYTKSNLLVQSAQSMLAQANQNPSNVLSLLQ